MKVSLKSRAGSTPEKLGILSCLDVAKSIHEATCGLAYADFVLSKYRKSMALDKHVQLVDVYAGLTTASRSVEAASKSLKSKGYEKLSKEAGSIKNSASKLLKSVVPTGKEVRGRVKQGDKQKLENGVKKLIARTKGLLGEATKACRGTK